MGKGQREMTYEELKYAYMKKVQRVQELEMENKSLNHILGEHIVACKQMEKKIKRYREALEFIGNHANESELMNNTMYTKLVKEIIEKALEESK